MTGGVGNPVDVVAGNCFVVVSSFVVNISSVVITGVVKIAPSPFFVVVGIEIKSPGVILGVGFSLVVVRVVVVLVTVVFGTVDPLVVVDAKKIEILELVSQFLYILKNLTGCRFIGCSDWFCYWFGCCNFIICVWIFAYSWGCRRWKLWRFGGGC